LHKIKAVLVIAFELFEGVEIEPCGVTAGNRSAARQLSSWERTTIDQRRPQPELFSRPWLLPHRQTTAKSAGRGGAQRRP
jgi:hypothetical protein